MSDPVTIWRRDDPDRPLEAINVDAPTIWASPFGVGEKTKGNQIKCETWKTAAEKYYTWVSNQPHLIREIRAKLRGRDLYCSAPDGVITHAEVIATIANEPLEGNRSKEVETWCQICAEYTPGNGSCAICSTPRSWTPHGWGGY